MNDYHREFETGQLIESAAEIYESFFVPALFADWPGKILDLASINQQSKLLDVACGTGVLAREAVLRCNDVTGVDLNPEMLAVASSSNQEVCWEQGNAESLPFEDGLFDVVASQFGLMFYDDKVKAIREQYRVLKLGGQLLIAVWGPIDDASGYAAMKSLGVRLFGEQLSSSFDAPFILWNKDELLRVFKQAEIGDVHIRTLNGTARYPSIDSWVYTDIKGWTLAGALDDDQFEILLEAARIELQPFAQEDESVAFSVPAHVVLVNKNQ